MLICEPCKETVTPTLRFQSVEQALDYRESKWFVRGAGTLVEIIRCVSNATN